MVYLTHFTGTITAAVRRLKAFLPVALLLLPGSFAFSKIPTDATGKDKGTIYFFSGLGADSSPFVNLHLPGYNKVYISWIPPLANESLEHYAGRISNQITVTDPYIIGLSFGGIVAVEVSKQIAVKKMVLISSVRTRDELNPFNRFFMRLGMYRIIPGFMIKHANFLTYRYFGAHTERDKKALTHLLGGTDIPLFRWGLKSIAHWDNREMPGHTIQIHGTADKVIASRLVHPDYSIKGGGHLMVFSKADTISSIILNYFQDQPVSYPENTDPGITGQGQVSK
ncbi:alpha/beta hydrolase [Taibaiella koreensis]|uniref:alpha/beta hydrolase n=1 Tax=Taibaiella koreensis TaxID=1268548 RepID=UPI000E59DFF2|nr:alpha/beta hydrolase [Taibaiella koreensis]